MAIIPFIATADPQLANLAPAPSVMFFTAVSATGLIKASPGRILALRYDSTAVLLSQFFQIFNKAAIPVLGDVPVFNFLTNRLAALPINLFRDFFGPSGASGSIGLSWGLSSTPATFTAAAPAAGQFVNVIFM